MILKFLRNKRGGSTASIDYLLNKERVQNGTARILKGDEQNTRDIINSITKKQKVTFGVLSFEEANITEQQKKELMQEFEKTFFAGMKQEQYNILWVEHTDKDRLELNFIIPKVELSTGRSFNPYYHKTDFHLADLFQKKMNLKYGFSDPQDPAKQSSIQGNKKALGLFRGYRNLDKKLKELVSEGVLQSRDDIIEILKSNNIEVTKIEDDKIEAKLENSKKPRFLKGDIYTNEFRSIDELRDIGEKQAQRERAFASRNREVEYGKVSERLERAVSKRADFYAEEYRKTRKRDNATKRDKQGDSKEATEQTRKNTETSNENNEAREIQATATKSQLLAEVKGGIDDRTRKTIATRARERAAAQQRARELVTTAQQRVRETTRDILARDNEYETTAQQRVRELVTTTQQRTRERERERQEFLEYAKRITDTARSITSTIVKAFGTIVNKIKKKQEDKMIEENTIETIDITKQDISYIKSFRFLDRNEKQEELVFFSFAKLNKLRNRIQAKRDKIKQEEEEIQKSIINAETHKKKDNIKSNTNKKKQNNSISLTM